VPGAARRFPVRAISLWGPVIATMGLIFWLSSQSVLPSPPGRLTDKQAHALAYATLAALWGRAQSGGRWSGVTGKRVLIAAAGAVFYGITDELHQGFVPGRSSELADLAADAVGAAIAGFLLWACGIIQARRRAWHAGASR
jgi:VanZ family protein